MATGDKTSLLLRIKGDSSDAVKAINKVEGEAAKLAGTSGKLGETLGAVGGPAGIAAAAIAAIGTAALGVGTALFNVAKATSDYGSEIFDATEKTGLAAETISSLKFAADQAGSSLAAVEGGLSRFAKTIGEAASGSKDAQEKLDRLHVTSTDLDTALGQALTTIAKYAPGVAQMTAAQAAFGKSGADLLPFIKSFDGDLPGLIAKCKALGLTLSKDGAKAADEFGDNLDTLQKQLGAVGKTVGLAVMPTFSKLFSDLGGWLQQNQGLVTQWAGIIADAFKGALIAGKNLINGLMDAKDFFGAYLTGGNYKDYQAAASERARLAMGPDTGPSYLPGGGRDPQNAGGGEGYIYDATGGKNTPPKTNVINVPRADNQGDFNRDQREIDRKEAQEAIENERQTMAERLEIFAAGREKMAAIAAQYADVQKKTATEVAEFEERMDLEVMEERKRLLQEYIEFLKNAGPEGIDALRRAEVDLQVLEDKIETQRANNAVKQQERNKDEQEALDKRNQSWAEYIEKLAEAEAKEDGRQQRQAERDAVESSGGVMDSLGDSLGVPLFDPAITDQVAANADFLKSVYADLAESAGQALGQMAQGLGNLLSQWIITGKFSAKAALQMAAGVAMGLAIEAGLKALFNVAEGLAAAANPFTAWMAPGYFAAAKAYALTAAAAGAVGVGLAVAGRAVGGSSANSASSSFAGQTGSQRRDRNVDGQGKQYSSLEDQTVGGSRNAPKVQVQLHLKLSSAGVIGVIEDSIRTNGRMRDLIIDTD